MGASEGERIDFPVDEVTVTVDEETEKSVFILVERIRHVYPGVLGSANITSRLPTCHSLDQTNRVG